MLPSTSFFSPKTDSVLKTVVRVAVQHPPQPVPQAQLSSHDSPCDVLVQLAAAVAGWKALPELGLTADAMNAEERSNVFENVAYWLVERRWPLNRSHWMLLAGAWKCFQQDACAEQRDLDPADSSFQKLAGLPENAVVALDAVTCILFDVVCLSQHQVISREDFESVWFIAANLESAHIDPHLARVGMQNPFGPQRSSISNTVGSDDTDSFGPSFDWIGGMLEFGLQAMAYAAETTSLIQLGAAASAEGLGERQRKLLSERVFHLLRVSGHSACNGVIVSFVMQEQLRDEPLLLLIRFLFAEEQIDTGLVGTYLDFCEELIICVDTSDPVIQQSPEQGSVIIFHDESEQEQQAALAQEEACAKEHLRELTAKGKDAPGSYAPPRLAPSHMCGTLTTELRRKECAQCTAEMAPVLEVLRGQEASQPPVLIAPEHSSRLVPPTVWEEGSEAKAAASWMDMARAFILLFSEFHRHQRFGPRDSPHWRDVCSTTTFPVPPIHNDTWLDQMKELGTSLSSLREAGQLAGLPQYRSLELLAIVETIADESTPTHVVSAYFRFCRALLAHPPYCAMLIDVGLFGIIRRIFASRHLPLKDHDVTRIEDALLCLMDAELDPCDTLRLRHVVDDCQFACCIATAMDLVPRSIVTFPIHALARFSRAYDAGAVFLPTGIFHRMLARLGQRPLAPLWLLPGMELFKHILNSTPGRTSQRPPQVEAVTVAIGNALLPFMFDVLNDCVLYLSDASAADRFVFDEPRQRIEMSAECSAEGDDRWELVIKAKERAGSARSQVLRLVSECLAPLFEIVRSRAVRIGIHAMKATGTDWPRQLLRLMGRRGSHGAEIAGPGLGVLFRLAWDGGLDSRSPSFFADAVEAGYRSFVQALAAEETLLKANGNDSSALHRGRGPNTAVPTAEMGWFRSLLLLKNAQGSRAFLPLALQDRRLHEMLWHALDPAGGFRNENVYRSASALLSAITHCIERHVSVDDECPGVLQGLPLEEFPLAAFVRRANAFVEFRLAQSTAEPAAATFCHEGAEILRTIRQLQEQCCRAAPFLSRSDLLLHLAEGHDSETQGPSQCCAVCGDTNTKRCEACHAVSYCSRAHQKADWKRHKLECDRARVSTAAAAVAATAGGCITFRRGKGIKAAACNQTGD